MKKIIIVLFFLAGTLGFVNVNAQKKTTAKPKAKTTATTTATTSTTHTKKDGTLDMRYKENKGKKEAPAGPLKKNGTPDMRYKANKTAAKTK
jgi:hypothetical protein